MKTLAEMAVEYAEGCDNESGGFLTHQLEAIRSKAFIQGARALAKHPDVLAMREALAYYADEKNWYDVNRDKAGAPVLRMVIGSIDTTGPTWIGGHQARLALAGFGGRRMREWWLIPDDKILYSNRRHSVLDDEQAKEYQAEWDGKFGPPKTAVRVIEKTAYDALSTRLSLAEQDRDSWKSSHSITKEGASAYIEQLERERADLRRREQDALERGAQLTAALSQAIGHSSCRCKTCKAMAVASLPEGEPPWDGPTDAEIYQAMTDQSED